MNKNIILVLALILIGGSIWFLEGRKATRNTNSGQTVAVSDNGGHTADFATRALKYSRAPELVKSDGYINTVSSTTLGSLVGKKVILLDFWTYSCINCQRTIPHLNALYEKYKDQGLEIVSVHTPEFEFEKKIENVQQAVNQYGIKYPVVLDNEYATWDAYKNQYWPAHYLIDINGLVVDKHIGEGGYEDTEKKIQELLKERKEVLGEQGSIDTTITQINDVVDAKSPETYFGWARNEFLSNGTPHLSGVEDLNIPASFSLNKLYLGGSWNFEKEYAQNTTAGAKIVFKYNAKNVYFVASSEAGNSIRVLRDGAPVTLEKGEDVDTTGKVIINNARLYKLISEKEAGTHTLEIIIENSGLQAFTFTFG